MPILSLYARKEKINFFFNILPKDASILEVGCAGGWLGEHLKKNSFSNYTGIDLVTQPGNISGNILDWMALGIKPQSFDVIAAFEVVEHVPCFRELFEILKPGGLLFLTSPLPHMDWLCRIFEYAGLNQKRTSPHDHLIYFRDVPYFELLELKIKAGIVQWGKFRKPMNAKGAYK
jgi:SAM-dependent methyltransferase